LLKRFAMRGHRSSFWRRAAALVALAVLASSGPARAQVLLPDVDILLVLEIQDTTRWLGFYETVLGTSRESPKQLSLGVAMRKGAARWLAVDQPRFVTEGRFAAGASTLKVVVTGKVGGGEALRGLATFQSALLEMQAASPDARLTLVYGLAETSVQLLEMHLSR
jgi:hypothetical protein